MNIAHSIPIKETNYSFNTLLNRVFFWMGLGLAVTAAVSYLFATDAYLLSLLATPTGITALGYVVMFAPIGFVFLMSIGFSRFSYLTLMLLFMAYASIMGASLSFIFLIYTAESIFKVFVIAALMFGGMGAIGYFSKTDLTKMGNLLLIALMGLIIASLVNMFMKSDAVSYVISFISVLVFLGLTAYDIQKLKRLNEDSATDDASKSKLGIMGALTLYLDFINLFLSLLRLFGNRKSN